MPITITGVSAVEDSPDPQDSQVIIDPNAKTGHLGDRLFKGSAGGAGLVVIALVTLIGVFLVWQALPALQNNDANFITSREWSVDSSPMRFGILELLWTTVVASTIAMVLAVPVGIALALFMTEYAPQWLRRPAASLVDLLAAVPSVVYGLWGLSVFLPVFKPVQNWLSSHLGGIPLFANAGMSDGTILFIGIVLAIMILPIITALTREVFAQTPATHKEAALALGSWSLLNGGETFASRIANNSAEFSSPAKTGAFIAAGLVLFVLTFIVNAIARVVIERRKAFSE